MPSAYLLVSVLMLLFQKVAPAPAPAAPPPPPPAGFPNSSESLNYSINWPTGLSLGEAHMRAGKTETGWDLDFSLDASVPTFSVADHFHSITNKELCSLEFEKQISHGSRTGHEKTVFDYKAGSATRTTLAQDAGHSDIDISSCVHDGLAYLYLARKELAQNRMPPQEDIFFGARYSVHMVNSGQMEIKVGGKPHQADRVVISIKSTNSDIDVEAYFDRDPAHTPLLFKAPFALGTFSMELAR